MYFLVVTNSPGELVGWVQPLARALRRACPEGRIVLVIPPCQFASGRELDVARRFSEVEQVLGPRDYIRFLFLGRRHRLLRSLKGEEGVCIFLGGDPFHAVLVARKMHIPLAGYLRTPRWRGQFRRYMVRSEQERSLFLEQGIPQGRVCVVGDLMIDAFCPADEEDDTARWEEAGISRGKRILLLPGSRPGIARNMIPFFLGVCELLAAQFPRAEFSLLLSPFLGKDIVETVDDAWVHGIMPLPRAQVTREEAGPVLVSEGGVRVRLLEGEHEGAMRSMDLALTIPGTNTMELACMGTPMVVVVPLNRPELVPLDGLAGLVGKIPVLGSMVKSYAINLYCKRVHYCALPNIKAHRQIVPEVMGKIMPADVARVAASLLRDRGQLQAMSEDLRAQLGQDKGATGRFARCCLELVRE
jgi:lipid-A-disaccharide synthase